MKKKFPCTIDKLARIIPYIMSGISLVILIIGVIIYKVTGQNTAALTIFISPVALVITLIITYNQMPISVNIDETSLSIQRKKAKTIVIPFADTRYIEQIPDNDLKFSVRLVGNGGVFGYTGNFYNRKFGNMKWYCTQRKNYILIEKNDNKKIVVTPDDPEGVINEIKKINGSLFTITK